MVLGKRFLVMAIIFSFLFLPLGATAIGQNSQDPAAVSSGYMTADIVAARPVGLASTILGTATFIVSSPFSALGGNFEHSFTELVKKPFLYTFKRPLGIF
jgi:hypothetical protein